MTGWLVLSLVFYTLLIYVWIKGMGMVQKHKPQLMVTFYYVMAAIRFSMALTIVALYMIFSTHTRQETMTFCVVFSLMYVAMVIISITLKH